jgi:hypothetical protein
MFYKKHLTTMTKKRLNTHSVNAGTYRSDGPLSTKNKQKIAYYFILLTAQNKKVVPHPFSDAARIQLL